MDPTRGDVRILLLIWPRQRHDGMQDEIVSLGLCADILIAQ